MAEPTVVVEGDRIEVSRIELTDHDGAAYLVGLAEADRAAACGRALRVGLVALRQSGVTVNVDYMRTELERVLGRIDRSSEEAAESLERTMRQTFGDAEGHLPVTLERYFGDRGMVRKLVNDLFDEDRRDSAIGRMRTLLGTYFDGDGARLALLLNPEREGSPLHHFSADIREALDGIADRLSRLEGARTARADERARGTAKGVEFEVAVAAAVETLVQPLGDVLEDTSTLIGDSVRAKKGDAVLHLNPQWTGGLAARVAIELKSGPVRLQKLTEELAAARANRAAQVGIVIMAPGCAPAGCAPLTMHGSDVICEFDPETGDTVALDAALRLARSLALAALRADSTEVDLGRVRDRLGGIRNALARVRSLKSTLTSMNRATAEVDAGLDQIRAEVLSAVADIEAELASGATGSAVA